MNLQRLKLGILVGIVAFSFTVVIEVQADNRPRVRRESSSPTGHRL